MNSDNFCYHHLSHAQKRIWYVEKINSGSPMHNLGGIMKINTSIHIELMRKTLELLVKKNQSLRFNFKEINKEPVQYEVPYEGEEFPFIDFSSEEDPHKVIEKWTEDRLKNPFAMEQSRLYDFVIYKVHDKEYGIFLKIHHIISDGWSISLIASEVCSIYQDLLSNNIIDLNYPNYSDYIEKEDKYLNSERFIKNKAFWNEKYKEETIPESFLYNSSEQIKGKRKVFELEQDFSTKLIEFCSRKRISLNTIFLGAMAIYINKTTGEDDIILGTPVFNRSGRSEKNTVGMFTSTVPFRLSYNENLRSSELFALINRELKLCLFNQRYPYENLIKDLSLSNQGYDSIFKFTVNYYNSTYKSEINGNPIELTEYYCGEQSYSLQLTVKQWKEHIITLNFDYKTNEYSEGYIESLYSYIVNILKSILNNEKGILKNICLIDNNELDLKINKLNDTSANFPYIPVCRLFSEQAHRTPNKTALLLDDKSMTYGTLEELSNNFGSYLLSKGLRKGDFVTIIQNHSMELIISILAVLKCGCTYIPIYSNYPKDRINYILKDSNSKFIITDNPYTSFNDIKTINVYEDPWKQYKSQDLYEDNIDMEDSAYIIYTSGTTGKPKGAVIKHKGLTNYICWSAKMYLTEEDDSMALYSSIAFDLTVTTLFAPLISGHSIVIYPEKEDEDFVLYRILKDNKTTVVKLTPSHLTLLKNIDTTGSKIKRFIVGGENLTSTLSSEIYKTFNGNIELCNEYGPTETTVGCMLYRYKGEKLSSPSVPIGVPAQNVHLYVLDKNLKITPDYATGELYIGGLGVCKGYLNNAELTDRSFIKGIYNGDDVIYKSGDICRYLPGGIIEYIGRSDKQVKLRGHRIELSEIENRILLCEGVKEATLILNKDKDKGDFLDAYVKKNKDITIADIKIFLKKFLPSCMIPTHIMFIDEIPLTGNGKVDVKALPPVEEETKEYIKYKNEVEKELIKAMEELLGKDSISMKDNFYSLGGDSIKAIQISSKLKNSGFNLKVKDILSSETIEEIASSIEAFNKPHIISQDMQTGFIENTPIINWFMYQNFNNPDTYNQYVILETKNEMREEYINKAISKLIQSHDMLRVNYNKEKKQLFYNDIYLNKEYKCKTINISNSCHEKLKEQHGLKYLIDQIPVDFNIENSLLFNITKINANNRYFIVFIAHHLLIDGVSWRIILSDFMHLISNLYNNTSSELPLKTDSFKLWSNKLKEYGDNIHEDFSIINNEDFKFPSFSGIYNTLNYSAETINETLTNEQLSMLSTSAEKAYSIDINECFIIALILSIKKFTGENNVALEVEGHGRELIDENMDISRTVGWFTTMYPIVGSLGLDDSHEEEIKKLKEQIRKGNKEGFNYSINRYLYSKENIGKVSSIRYNYLGDLSNIEDNPYMKIKSVEFGLNSSRENHMTALIDIEIITLKNNTQISITYSKDSFDSNIMNDFMLCYKEEIEKLSDWCTHKEDKEFTPSDFSDVDISQEDLDALFN